jgi:hypothetical protein
LSAGDDWSRANEKDISYVGVTNKYTMYSETTGWMSYDQSAIHKLLGLVKPDERLVFDDVLRATSRMKESTAMSFRIASHLVVYEGSLRSPSV